jgi:hypothetical protein
VTGSQRLEVRVLERYVVRPAVQWLVPTASSAGAGPTRFQPTYWAAMTSSNAEIQYASGPVASDAAHVCYQVGVNTVTPAGNYSTTIVYTAVANF